MKKKAKKRNVKGATSSKKNIADNGPKEKTFDFGGLPDRDLKKSLGC
jgi:hypothetical protein